MTPSGIKTTTVATTVLASAGQAAATNAADDFIARIQSQDDAVRGPAWQGAGTQGAPAVKLLVPVMRVDDFEVARSAQRALWKIVRHAGRPGAAKEARAVANELVAQLAGTPAAIRRELLWMLSEIGGDDALPAMAALLTDREVREDARAAIMRLPGRKATAALRAAFTTAPDEFKYSLAESLRNRGESVKGFTSQKLVPSRPTAVTYVPPKPA